MLLAQSDTLHGINRKNNLADHIHLMKVVKFQTFLPPRKTSTTARNSFENEKSPFDLQSTLLQLNYLSGLNNKKKKMEFCLQVIALPTLLQKRLLQINVIIIIIACLSSPFFRNGTPTFQSTHFCSYHPPGVKRD